MWQDALWSEAARLRSTRRARQVGREAEAKAKRRQSEREEKKGAKREKIQTAVGDWALFEAHLLQEKNRNAGKQQVIL